MNIDLTRLVKSFTDKLEIDEVINFDETYINNTDIRKLDNIRIKGTISKTESDIYNLHLSVFGVMILPCALTLEDVKYPFSIEISEILSENDEDDEKYLKISGNYIDIIPIIWQNIVLEIPLRVVSEGSYKINRSGNGWKLITNKEDMSDDTIDPRLEKLRDLLED